ncbi:S-locus glycoprotein domain-containing protein [Artemisia annua]|uniref:S-locus glycoprotein domain-containing protein n=1 Tax=Artemisia annua TaxID=35608 RepID=A0A2U1MYT5_ARTAN|nr:S-locus glycoprotein domain-containing protein [Artemisia annua]
MKFSMEGVVIHLLFCFLFFHKICAAELDIISDSQFLTDGDTLVSQTRIFELGFFRPNNSENRYLGMWFKNISVRTVVWVANRDHPLPATPQLVVKITDSGALGIFNNISIIWSSNTTSSQKATAKLLDTGNLVVTDELFGTIIWQSFDYPTDTLLPGMKLGKDYSRGMEWHLSSWKSSQDPARGAFAWQADTLGYPYFELKDTGVVKHRGGPWRNERFSGISIGRMILTFVIDVVIIDTEVSYSYYIENSTSILSKLTMNSSGVLESMVWVEEIKKWQTFLSFPRDTCDTYNVCGAYGRCTIVNLVEKSCACLDQYRFVPKDDDFSGGCVRRTPLDCKNGSEGFIKYSNIKLPDTKRTWFNTSMSLENCAEKCLQNCSCMAYADTQIRGEGTGCLIWFNDLIDIKVLVPVGGRDIFVRIASSEIGSSSDPAGASDLPSDPTAAKKNDGSKIKIILLTVFPGILLIGFSILLLWYARMKKNNAVQKNANFIELL